jgi:PAS domain S-box-containing protein
VPLASDIAEALNRMHPEREMLQSCTEAIVRRLGAAFARIWTLDETGLILELQASAGLYTRLDGTYRRVRVGERKIGAIAAERRAHLTNDVPNDPRIGDPAWARRERMVAFAGYPLLVDDRLVGVMALFARQPLGDDTLAALASVADAIALGIERKRAEAALRESEERLRLMIDSALDAVVAMDAEGRIQGWNSQAEAIFGWRRDEALGRSLAATIIPPGQRPAHTAGLARFLATGEGPLLNRRIEVTALRRDDTEFPVELTITPLTVGGAHSFSAFVRDISERKRAEQRFAERTAELSASEARFRGLLETAPEAIFVLDPATQRIVDGNQNMADLVGRRLGDLIGSSAQDLSAPSQPPDGLPVIEAAARRIAEMMASDGPLLFEWVVRHSDGHDIPVEIRAVRLPTVSGDLARGSVHDISARKAAEGELLRTLAREKELGELKSRFVSMVSHEFRTPLGIIHSSAEILERYFERLPPERRREQLASITQAARNLAALIDEVLLLSRVEAGRMQLVPAPLDLPRLLRQLVDEVASATSHRCPIALEVTGLSGEATGDESLLRHILTNLIANAVKYSCDGDPVDLAARRDGDAVIFTVRDRGIGIAAEDQKRLFTAFHRGGNVGDRPGTGLGLVIVRQCVDVHLGTISLQSALGQGTSVTVRLPVFSPALARTAPPGAGLAS